MNPKKISDLKIPTPENKIFEIFTVKFERLFNETMRDPEKTSDLFSWEGESEDITDECAIFSRHEMISPLMLRPALVICILLARTNAARALPDEKALQYFQNELNTLIDQAQGLISVGSLSNSDICLLYYVQTRIEKSRIRKLI